MLEAVFRVFQEDPSKWFLPRQDQHCSILTLTSLRPTSYGRELVQTCTPRQKKLTALGALTTLLLINGIAPIPLSPILLHFFIHDCNINSIHSSLLANWYPDLRKCIQDWISTGPDGDAEPFASHFMTFHDLQVS